MRNVKSRFALLLCLLVSPIAFAADMDFPKGPVNMKEAEAKGLHRLSLDELKGFFPGVTEAKGAKGTGGGMGTRTHRAGGKVEVASKSGDRFTGTWRLDEKRAAYCQDLRQKGALGEKCFAVYSAGDDIHYFDYDLDDGLFSRAWRVVATQ